MEFDDGLLFFYGGLLLLMVHAKQISAEMLNSNKSRPGRGWWDEPAAHIAILASASYFDFIPERGNVV